MRDDHRKARLRYLIKTDYGTSANFARETEFSKARVSQASGPKEPFAEDAATKWEDTLGLPRGWFNNTWPTPKEARRMKNPIDQPYPDAAKSAANEPLRMAEPRPPVISETQWRMLSPRARAFVEELCQQAMAGSVTDADIAWLHDSLNRASGSHSAIHASAIATGRPPGGPA